MSWSLRTFDRLLIESADEILQDVVVSFSARPLTVPLRLVVGALYALALLQVVFAAVLPFFRQAILHIIREGAVATEPQLEALSTGIIVGAISFHLAMMASCVVFSFLARAGKPWTRTLGSVTLGGNLAVAVNALRAPDVGRMFALLNIASIVLSTFIVTLWWYADRRLRAASTVPLH